MKKSVIICFLFLLTFFYSCSFTPQNTEIDTIISKSKNKAINTSNLLGINHAHCWYRDKLDVALTGIRSWGANSVRIVLACGKRWTEIPASEVSNIIALSKTKGFSAIILEVHDTTGYGEEGAAASLSEAADYWIRIKNSLIGQEDFVIINIGNEPYGNANYQNWTRDTTNAIKKLRDAGFTHTIMVDAPNWGQDWSFTMRDNAELVFNSDPQKNIVFSIHMYGVFDTVAEITNYYEYFKKKGLPLYIGEFGYNHSDGNPDEEAIVKYAKQYGYGYAGWSWCGNGGGVEYLDMVYNWDANNPSQWGSWYKVNALNINSSSSSSSTSISSSSSISVNSSSSSISSSSSSV
ncbi:MAG: glycoside hydrolase family 5 protein, partial [Brevinematales bacterium]|nr:glycoside hydrolase family 5 protein [Brevinematales bacterium]